MNFDEIRDTVETLGWTWYEGEDGVELGQGSPAGEDFHFYVSKSNYKTPYEFIREVRECAENFDTEEHVKEVMGANGAPCLSELVEDAGAIKKMLLNLADALEGKTPEDEYVSSVDDFDKTGFMAYLEETFDGFENAFLRETVEKLISFGLYEQSVSKGQFVSFLNRILPQVELGEIAAFASDGMLTREQILEKEDWKSSH